MGYGPLYKWQKKGNQVYNPTYGGYIYDITPLATGRGPTLRHLQPNQLPASQQDPNPTTQRNPSTVDITDSCRFWTCISEKPSSFEVTLIMPRSLVCRGLHTCFFVCFRVFYVTMYCFPDRGDNIIPILCTTCQLSSTWKKRGRSHV